MESPIKIRVSLVRLPQGSITDSSSLVDSFLIPSPLGQDSDSPNIQTMARAEKTACVLGYGLIIEGLSREDKDFLASRYPHALTMSSYVKTENLAEERYTLKVLNAIDLNPRPKKMKGPRIDLSRIKKNDAKDFAALALDERLNRYWGYDYRDDLPSEARASPTYFYLDNLNDFNLKAAYSFMIKDYEGRLLGEAVIYNFKADNSAELGVRLFESAQHHGYAIEALSLLVAYAKRIHLSSLRYESYLLNAPSIELAKKLSFAECGRDENRIYFILKL